MTSVLVDRLDGLSSSTAFKGPCKVATSANITLSGLQTVDTVALSEGDRVLVIAQTIPAENGIYVASVGPWRRAKDFSNSRDVRHGTKVYVFGGSLFNREYAVSSADPIFVGTSSIEFVVAGANASEGAYASLGAPAVFRTVSEKLYESKSLLDYGGRGNGSFDNSSAWADAIEHMLTFNRGGTIRVPDGVYGATTQIVFPKTAGKWINVVGEGDGAVIDVTGTANEAFYVGGATAGGGTNFVAQNLHFVGDSTTTHKAFKLVNANGARFRNVKLDNMRDGFTLDASYAVSFVDCEAVNVGGITIYSTTSAHNMVVDRFKAYNSGLGATGQFLRINAHTDNLVIQNSVFEYCRQVFNLIEGGSATRFVGNYVEYFTVDPFGFGSGVYNATINENWIALGASFGFANWFGGEFKRNRFYDQTISFASSCYDVSSGGNRVTGTGSFTPCAAKTITSFLNSSTVGARPCTYFKDGNGFVHLTGEVTVGTNGSPVFVLPAGYRPYPAGVHPRFTAIAPVDNSNAYVVVDSSNGNVVPTYSGDATVSLDGISFRAD